MLSILASFAQEESRSISDNVKWGTRKRFEQGIPNGHFRVYGYHWEGDDLVPTPEEAAIVKRIFQNFLDGKSRLETEREFAAEGITTRDGCPWVDSNIKQVLTNVTYTGDLLLQKEFISDPIQKKRKKNHGELPQYYVADHHEAIIDRETFNYVQSEIARRKELGPLANKSLNITCFTGKIKCEKCGQSLMRNTRVNRAAHSELGDRLIGWICGTKKKKGGRCTTKEIPDRYIRQACADALGLEEFDEEGFKERVEFISVPDNGILRFHFKDGTEKTQTWVNTAKKDAWTPEARARASAYRRGHASMGKKGACALTSKIKCAGCGGNYQAETSGGMRYWRCRNERDGIPLREDVLQSVIADVLGTETFSEAAVFERLETITVDGGTLTFRLKDGTMETREWEKPRRRSHKASEEQKRKMSEIQKARWTPERRAEMSQKMKELRKERGKAWRK